MYYVVKLAITKKRRKTISRDFNGKDAPIINERIRAKEVRLIDDEGNNYGVIATSKALKMADEKGLDLVVVSPNQAPPVAKIMDYGKYKYEADKRAKEANLDAIHDTVHEMARDEARHGKAFKGLYDRYFG